MAWSRDRVVEAHNYFSCAARPYIFPCKITTNNCNRCKKVGLLTSLTANYFLLPLHNEEGEQKKSLLSR